MFGDVKKVRKFIEDEHIDYAEACNRPLFFKSANLLFFMPLTMRVRSVNRA